MKIFKYSILLSALFAFSSCDKDFEEINTNPNAPNTVEPALLLRQVIYNYGEEMSYEGFVAGNLLSQHFTMIDFNLFDRHSLSDPQLGGNPWPILYTNLRDNQIILDQALSNSTYEVYEGPSRILKAYIAAALTDIYGDAPYSEAVSGLNGNVNPAYDSQEDIYTAPEGILDNLEKAIITIQSYSGTQTLEGDILFNGNLDSWLKFAQSLRIKYLMRISDIVDVSAELQGIYNSGEFISTNSENAVFNFTDGRPNNFRMATLRDGDFNLFILSETMKEVLDRYNDPRLSVLFRPTGNDASVYNGLLNGPDASQTSISISDFSLTGTIFRDHTGDLDANFMTSWETYFLLAEAAQKGFISANAQAHYEIAVQQTFDYWQTELPASYLTTDSAAYGLNGADPLEQIITQKWIANSINGYEGWIEYRRTGFPNLKMISASLNNNELPVRMPYPADESALNTENYNNATATNSNSINAKVWWDVN